MKKDKKHNDRLLKDMYNPFEMGRRDFMKKIGGGLVVAFSVSELPLLGGTLSSAAEDPGINSYLKIGQDGRVSLFTGKIEMGQGPITSLPMMLADELDVSLQSIDIIMGDTDLCPWDEGTYGSLSTRVFGQTMRAAAAKARVMLLQMAAKELAVGADQLEVKDGIISSKQDKAIKISYAELTKGKKILETITGDAPMKKASEFKIMGTSRLHVDAYEKVTGQAKYAGDIQLPGLMRARILRPPSLGAKLISADTSGAESMEGVQLIRDGDFIAVLHKSQDMADLAISKVKSEYQEVVLDVNDKTLYKYIVEKATESEEFQSGGTLETGEKLSEKKFDLEYRDPYLAHAPIENHTATAVFEGEKLKIWASCQTPYPTKDEVAEALNMDVKNVRLMPVFTGGGFGGKTSNPQVIDAARLAKLSGKPVQVIYSRREEFMFDRLRPAAVVKIRSGLDAGGNISFWDYGMYLGGTRGGRHFYDIPNHRSLAYNVPEGSMDHPFYTGAWRAPSNNTNTFARESHIDIMAAAAGVDPLEFRLKHLKGFAEMATILKAGADKFGWTPAKNPSGRGFGLACGQDAGTDVAVFVEVNVDKKTGHIQVKRAVCSQNMGMVVNPQGTIIQAEGCIIMGLGYALSEEIRFESRKMLSKNFDDYAIPHFSWVPEIDVVLIDAQDDPPQGGGEPAIICMGSAIANAVFDATGARVHQLPLTPERVLKALEVAGGKK
jgi:nicotinate dehydrogenase subunit B